MQSMRTSATTTTKRKSWYNLATFPDVKTANFMLLYQLHLKTQQGISKLFGSKVKMTVKR